MKPSSKGGALSALTKLVTISTLSLVGCAVLSLKWRMWRDTRRWFFPFTLTDKNKYYFHGRDGKVYIRRQVSLSVIEESPIPTLGSVCVFTSLFKLFKLKALLKAERIDHEHVSTYYDLSTLTVHVMGYQVWPLGRTTLVDVPAVHAEGNVAFKGYLDETGEPRVMVQLAPYVGCNLSQAEYEELNSRTLKAPNLSYLEVNSKGMSLKRCDIPSVAEAIRKEYRAVAFEPWFGSKKTDGDGDVTAKLLTPGETVQQDDKPRPAGCLFPPPVDQPSVVYEVNKAAESVTYAERVKKYVQPKEAEWDAKYDKYMNEFIQFLVPEEDMHSLVPDTLDAVLERQKRPSQVKGFEEEKDNVYDPRATKDKTFQKNEVYPEFKAPRNIVNPEHQLRVWTATVVHILAEYLKKHSLERIYGFGDAPYLKQVFDRVSGQDNGEGKFLLDGKKLDAHIHSKMRELERKVLGRAFKKECHDTVFEIHLAQYEDSQPKCAFGTKMELHYSRRSGEGGTSIFNTICMIFVCYCILREGNYSPRDSWVRIGCHGGDDVAMVQFVSKDLVARVSDEMMIPLTIETAEKDQPWSFLGLTRIHDSLDVFVCDINRFVGKAAYSHVKNVPTNELIFRKMDPYSRMYGEMPLVGHIAKACIRLLNKEKFLSQEKYDELTRYSNGFMHHVLDNTCLPGPRTEYERHLVETYICEQLDLGLVQLRDICAQYDAAESWGEFPAGYVTNKNVILECAYECIFRDLYIQGVASSKLVSTLPTESPDGCTKSTRTQNNDKTTQDEANSGAASTGPTLSTDSSASTTSQKRKRQNKSRKEREGSKAHAGRA